MVFVNRDRVVRLGRAAVFWGIFVFLLHGGSVVAAPKSNTAEAGMEGRDIPSAGILAEPEGSLDVIVLGDSEGHSAVSPVVLWKEHGISSFVCGQSGYGEDGGKGGFKEDGDFLDGQAGGTVPKGRNPAAVCGDSHS